MTETLGFVGVTAPLIAALWVHHRGLVYSIRMIANWWYALAFAVEQFRGEFRRLNAEARNV